MRQLENAIFRAVVLADGDEVGVAEFPQLSQTARMVAPAIVPSDEAPQPARIGTPMILDEPSPPAPPASGDALALTGANGHVRPLEEIEADAIRFAIAHYRGQMSEVARRLRIGRSTLYRKLDEIGLAGGESSGASENVASE